MEKIDLILWVLTGGFGLMLVMWNNLNKRIDEIDSKLSNKIDGVDLKLSQKFDKLSEKVEDVDRRLCRIEGSLSTSGHCLFNQCKPEQKAE